MYGVEESLWVWVGWMHMEGTTARWLQSVEQTSSTTRSMKGLGATVEVLYQGTEGHQLRLNLVTQLRTRTVSRQLLPGASSVG
jgi:hypothetical protein